MKYILALDLGTTSTRAAIVDEESNICAIVKKANTSVMPHPGWVEQDPLQLWHNLLDAIHQVIELAKISSQNICAIGIANQRETTVLWNKKTSQPIANAIVWQDRRTADFCEYLKKQGNEKFIQAKTGLTLDPYFSASKIHYLLEHNQEATQLADREELAFGTIDSWIIWNLTKGKFHVTDVSNASRTLLFDIHKAAWDPELLKLFNIPVSILPKVVSSSEIVGEATVHPFKHAIPISGICGDQSGALFGQLCFNQKQIKITYGTGCFALINCANKIVTSKNNLLSTVAWQVGKNLTYALEGSVYIGGAVVQWLQDNLKIIKSPKEIEELAATVEDSANVFFVPTFVGLSAPHWTPKTKGMIIGLSRDTQNGHLARAALEGIAFQAADLIDTLVEDYPIAFKEIRVDGGASQNDLMMQFQADILNLPVVRPKLIETTIMGAAYLAGLGVGVWKNFNDLEKFWQPERIFEPKPTDLLKMQREKWKKAVSYVKEW